MSQFLFWLISSFYFFWLSSEILKLWNIEGLKRHLDVFKNPSGGFEKLSRLQYPGIWQTTRQQSSDRQRIQSESQDWKKIHRDDLCGKNPSRIQRSRIPRESILEGPWRTLKDLQTLGWGSQHDLTFLHFLSFYSFLLAIPYQMVTMATELTESEWQRSRRISSMKYLVLP